jgi:hypothetical protein
MVLRAHVPFYEEIFAIPGFLRDPILCFGYQEFDRGVELEGREYPDLGGYFAGKSLTNITLDLFDPRSELRYDMNLPVPECEHGRYRTFIDIGSLEHVFDTRQCFENCLRLVAPEGHYLLHTPVNGYWGHGFHVFNPECLLNGFELNGFRVLYVKYSDPYGAAVEDPSAVRDAIAWIVARKERGFDRFTCPQQGKWYSRYA